MVMKNYVEESVRFRMGDWYDKKFKLNEFSWDEIIDKNYVYRKNDRFSHFVNQFKAAECNLNPGLILTGIDHFRYDLFSEEVLRENGAPTPSGLRKLNLQAPIAAHNRHHCRKDSIILPLKSNLRWISNAHRDEIKDKNNFDEKKDEIIWRGSFTGRNKNHRTIHDTKDLKNRLNEFLRYNFVKKLSKKYNIKFVEGFWPLEELGSPDPVLALNNQNFIDNYFKENEYMVADRIPFFHWQACNPTEVVDQYKYILSLDGHDWASNVALILITDSVMISPIPKWHSIFSIDLTPWKHYVPILDDTSDLEEKLTWCRNHQGECKEIIQRATQYISQFSLDTEIEIAKNIIERLYNNSI